MTRTLSVFICGVRCGELREDVHGSLSFEYLPGYDGVPLSFAMPVGLARYGDRVVRPYLQGLLPDEEATRAAIGARFDVSGDNPFRLLSVMGLDCPGAVQLCAADAALMPEDPVHDLVELSEDQVARRLAAIRENAAFAWTDEHRAEGHWSLGGCQAKFALRNREGRWFECLGSAATTHILKPGVAGLDHQALVEYVSMRAARAVGLPVAEVEYHAFCSEPAIVVERYDRIGTTDGRIARLHQEDLCQALSISPASKYAEQGGPATPDIIEVLRRTGKNARENVYRFVLYLFFNYLIGATDAHAKNHSLVYIAPDDVRLAPLYDVASIAPYRSLAPRQRRPLRTALSVGGENRFGMVGTKHIEKMVLSSGLDELGLDARILCGRFKAMALLIPQAVDQAISDASECGVEGFAEIASRMKEEIAANCQRTLDNL